MRFVVSSLIALSLIGSASASVVETFDVKITYNKNAVQTAEGAQDVLEQIKRKARKDCRIGGTYNRLLKGALDQACVDDIVSQAVTKIDAVELTRIYQSELTQ